MKIPYLLIIIFFTCLNAAFSQDNLRNFKGRVLDSSTYKPLPDASICIYRASDTSLLNFGFTTPNGNFQLTTKSGDSLIVIISMFGFADHVIKEPAAEGWDWNFYGDVKLVALPYNFSMVTVKSAAIRMKGDTIEINASRFKVMPGSDVAQLFKKIPGFEVSVKGEIKVNGAPVNKIMVDGSDFFGNNPGMVSKNLSADMIETVQVFEELNEDGSPKQESSKIINLKLKKGKRNGTFGDAMAGYGTRQRYETGMRINNFKNDRKFSFIVNANNTNETGFDFGFQNWHDSRSPEKNGGSNSNDDIYYSYSSNSGEGNINNKLSSGLTYFNEFSRKRKLSFNVFGNRNNYNSIQASKSISPINDSTRRTNTDSSTTNGLAYSGSFEAAYTKIMDSTGWYDIGFSTSTRNNRSNSEASNIIMLNDFVLNRGTSSILNTSENRSMSLKGNFRKYSRKNKLNTLFANANYRISDNSNRSYQFLENSQDTFNNLNERFTRSNELLVKLTGKVALYKKLCFSLSADRWFQNNESEQLSRNARDKYSPAFEQDYQNRIDTLSIKLYNRMEQYTLKPSLSFSKKYWYIAGGYTFMNMRIKNRFRDSSSTINTNYVKALPFFVLSYYPGTSYMSFSASRSTLFPTVSELLPILNIANNYERMTGNKNLSPQDDYNFNLWCNLYKLKGFRHFYFSLNGSMSENAKIWVSRQGADGVITKTPENAKGQRDLGSWFSMSKKVTKVMSLDLSTRQGVDKKPLIINEQNAFGTNSTFSLSTGVNFSKSDSLDLGVGVSYNYASYKNSLNAALNFQQNTYSYYFNIRALFMTGTEVNSSLDISDQRNVPGIGRVVPVWSAYIQQPLTKSGKISLKLTAYDILKQNTNITRYASENFIYISQSNRLQQYFMLTLIYKIKKMGGEEDGLNYTF